MAYGFTHEELSREGVQGRASMVFLGWKKAKRRTRLFWKRRRSRNLSGLLSGEVKATETLLVGFKKPVE